MRSYGVLSKIGLNFIPFRFKSFKQTRLEFVEDIKLLVPVSDDIVPLSYFDVFVQINRCFFLLLGIPRLCRGLSIWSSDLCCIVNMENIVIITLDNSTASRKKFFS